MSTYCSKCNAENEDGARFCTECGAEIPSYTNNPDKTQIAVHVMGDKRETGKSESDRATIEKRLQDLAQELRELDGKPAGSNSSSSEIPSDMREKVWTEIVSGLGNVEYQKPPVKNPVGSMCPYMKFSWIPQLFFVSGMYSLFSLKITPTSSELKQVMLHYSPQVKVGTPMNEKIEVTIDEKIEENQSIYLKVPYLVPENLHGIVKIDYFISCEISGKWSTYQCACIFKVYKPDERATSVVNQISLTGCNAVKLQNSMTELLRRNQDQSVNVLLENLIDILNDEESYEEIGLKTSHWNPNKEFFGGDVYPSEALTCEIEGYYYHLICKNEVKFGRVQTLQDESGNKITVNDIAVHDLTKTKSLNEWPNNTVSRKHMQIHYCGDSINLIDTSSYGTYINGMKAYDNRGIVLPDEAELAFGDIVWKMQVQRCGMRKRYQLCRTCPCKSIRSVIMSPQNKTPEHFLLVWECIDLGSVEKKLSGLKIVRCNGGFILKTLSGQYLPLEPYQTIELPNGMKMRVFPYQQYE